MPKKYTIVLIIVLFVSIAGGFFFFTSKNVPQTVKDDIMISHGITDNEIRLGSSAALSGHAGKLGTDYLHGAMSFINRINEDGGVHGRTIKVVSYDDMYDPPKVVENTQKLINEDDVFLLFDYVGTPTTLKVIPIVEEAKIPLIGIFSGAQVLRSPFRKNIFNIRASYYQETEMALKYFVDHLGLKKIAVFYQSDAYGMDGFEGAVLALKKRNLEPVAVGVYNRGTLEVEDAVASVVESDAEVVIMIGTYGPSAKFVKLVKSNAPDILFHSVSFVGTEEFIKELGDDTNNVYITEVVPSPNDSDLPQITVGYEEDLHMYYPNDELTFGGLEGYVNAKIIIEGLRLAGNPPTREKFIKAVESIQDADKESDFNFEFNENDHQGLDDVYLVEFKDGKYNHIHIQ